METSSTSSPQLANPRLSHGDTLKGSFIVYEVDAFLGEGLTADVYLGHHQERPERKVALKVIKRNLFRVTEESFWNEPLTINELAQAGLKAYVPEVYEVQKAGPRPFIAMELIGGDLLPVSDLTERVGLDEEEGLELAVQALALLEALHDRVGRSYTDMQLNNFRWSCARRQLMVMDWNHVSLRKEEYNRPDPSPQAQADLKRFGARNFDDMARYDLSRFGAYLYRILTGKGVADSGESEYLLARRAGKRWGELTLGTRQLLARALHPNLDRRFHGALRLRKRSRISSGSASKRNRVS